MEIGRFRWRLVVGWFLIVFGGLLAGLQPIGLTVGLVFVPRPWFMTVFGSSLHFSAGCIWVLCGRGFLARHLRQPLLGCLVGYVFGVAGAMCLWPAGI